MRIETHSKREVIDITNRITEGLTGDGVLNVFVTHTTAAVTIADLDPGTETDYLLALDLLTPGTKWNHPHDPAHFPDHLWSSIIGNSLTIPFKNGQLLLGSWQRVVLIELDGPRQRNIELTKLASH